MFALPGPSSQSLLFIGRNVTEPGSIRTLCLTQIISFNHENPVQESPRGTRQMLTSVSYRQTSSLQLSIIWSHQLLKCLPEQPPGSSGRTDVPELWTGTSLYLKLQQLLLKHLLQSLSALFYFVSLHLNM